MFYVEGLYALNFNYVYFVLLGYVLVLKLRLKD